LQYSTNKIPMLTKESIYVILFSLPVYQLLFYTVQLISFKRKNPSKKYLGLLLLSMTTFLVINALHFIGYNGAFSYLYLIYLPVLLSITPVYFLYILSITQENHDVNKMHRLILFAPAILVLIANTFILNSLDPSTRIGLFDQGMLSQGPDGNRIPGLMIAFWIIAIVLIFGQIAFAIAKVSKIMQSEADIMRKQPSHLAYLEWRWILGISISVLIFLVINALIEMVVPVKYMALVVIYNILMLLSGGLTGYLGMKQDDLLNQVEKINLSANSFYQDISTEYIKDDIVPPANNLISEAEAAEIHLSIINYLKSQKPYCQPDFSMHDLCNHLNISRRKVSYVLNEILHKNFYGIINEHRVKEAEELLMKDELNQLKIEVLGEMVGFQSKSSFNACFKKVTGMTPSEYRIKKRLLYQPPDPNSNS
jgi:AraC-like DNA-binding protein